MTKHALLVIALLLSSCAKLSVLDQAQIMRDGGYCLENDRWLECGHGISMNPPE